MFGILILICFYAVLGFFMAWVANIVTKEEMEVKTGFLIVFVAGIVGFVAKLGITAGLGPAPALFLSPVVNFAVLLLCIKMFGQLEWMHSAIIAGIYTALMFVFTLGLTMCVVAAT